MERDLICQGDVNLIPAPDGKCAGCGAVFESSKATKRPDGVLAKGESTGHSHALLDQDSAEILDTDNGAWLRLKVRAVPIGHQEHSAVDAGVVEEPLRHIHIDQAFDYTAR